MKKVLILTAGFGNGHHTAASNVADALEAISDEVKVDVLDLFQDSRGVVNGILKTTYRGLSRYAPGLWNGVHSLLDDSKRIESRLLSSVNLKKALEETLERNQPDCVISIYPIYSQLVDELYPANSAPPFKLITVVTDAVSVNPSWYRSPSDWFCVANDAAVDVLASHGVPREKVKPFGFPVNPVFAETRRKTLEELCAGGPIKILYIINSGKRKSSKAVDRLLEMPNAHLTIVAGRDAELRQKLAKRAEECADRVRLLGWTNQMPALMLSHHLVISGADEATVQEAIAARCPMILNQMVSGEEGSARWVQQNDIGVVALKTRKVVEWVAKTFAADGRIWRSWRENLARISKPDASLRIAELALSQCDSHPARSQTVNLFANGKSARNGTYHTSAQGWRQPSQSGPPSMLQCDFHIHTNYSDGKLTAPDVVDFYGRRGFDCICITDHLGDPRRAGKLGPLANLTLVPGQMDEYFEVLARERQRAWRKYNMIVLAGIEFNKDGSAKKTSAHLLGVDLKAPINPAFDLPETIKEIHAQGGLAIASHPHVTKSEWGKNTLFLWENQDQFAPLLDAWEIASRNNIFTPAGLKRLAFVANSDFHKPKHIYSWKTLLRCEKDAEAIKKCIRQNEHVAITLYRGTEQQEARKVNEAGAAGEALALKEAVTN